MKQHITKSNWDELSDGEKDKFKNKVKNFGCTLNDKEIDIGIDFTPDIGQMIEFLGDDFLGLNENLDNVWNVNVLFKNTETLRYYKDELVDALWQAVKYKLKEKK